MLGLKTTVKAGYNTCEWEMFATDFFNTAGSKLFSLGGASHIINYGISVRRTFEEFLLFSVSFHPKNHRSE